MSAAQQQLHTLMLLACSRGSHTAATQAASTLCSYSRRHMHGSAQLPGRTNILDVDEHGAAQLVKLGGRMRHKHGCVGGGVFCTLRTQQHAATGF